jgi:hypothetical protein
MIAISIFLIIVTLGMGALLNVSSLHNKSKDMLSIMDSLSFTMDDMSRNLRTGNDYYCLSSSSDKAAGSIPDNTPTSGSTLSGQNCMGIAFNNSEDGTQWMYETYFGAGVGYIEKSVNGGAWVQMTPSEVVISTSSPFSVLGAEPPPNTQQPFTTIHLTGTIIYKTTTTSFSLQTSVSQRQIDI